MTKRINYTEIPFLTSADPVISIAGAGGKTTLMFDLAKKFPGPVVMTTTTKVGAGQILKADICLELKNFPPKNLFNRMWVSPSLEAKDGKITGFTPEEFSTLSAICRNAGITLINEADGAAQKHIKAPAAHEPVIPEETNICIYAVGLDALGKPVNGEFVHRPEIFTKLTGLGNEEKIDTNSVIRLLEHAEGGLKNMPGQALRIAYLTHGNTPDRQKAGELIAAGLSSYQYVIIR